MPDGTLVWDGLLVDVTERRAAEAALAASEARFRGTFEQAAVGIAHVAPDGRWLMVNDRLCAIVGYGREELLGLTFQDVTHPEDLEADLAQVRALLRRQRFSQACVLSTAQRRARLRAWRRRSRTSSPRPRMCATYPRLAASRREPASS